MIFMNEMYAMSQTVHIYAVIGLIVLLLFMLAIHKVKGSFEKFVKSIKILMIIHLSLLGFIVLTGAIMLAAQEAMISGGADMSIVSQLSFTPANLLMIVAFFIIAALEIKRNRALSRVIRFKLMNEQRYKKLGFRYLLIELFVLLGVSAFSEMSSAVPF